MDTNAPREQATRTTYRQRTNPARTRTIPQLARGPRPVKRLMPDQGAGTARSSVSHPAAGMARIPWFLWCWRANDPDQA
jgi:hypothetical protein